MKKAVILSTGDELITGRVVDTNAAFIADKLFALGLDVVAVLKVGDVRERLLWALREAQGLGELIIGTGGLGPTADDLTAEMVARYTGKPLKMDERVADALKRRFESRGTAWTPNNLKQALFPEGAEILPNPLGTAPGFRVTLGSDQYLLWLSGVPREMEAMMSETVLPWLSHTWLAGETVWSCTFKLHGLSESKLDDIVKPVCLPAEARLSFRAHYPDLSLRLTVRGDERKEREFRGLKSQIADLLKPYAYAERDQTLEEVVGNLLLKTNWTLAVAESCTGGAIAHRITSVAGSSAYFKCGVIPYSNEAKVRELGVLRTTIQKFGAVSRETAVEMAGRVREQAEASVGVSTTGIAGPSGGSEETPVGIVWIGIAHHSGSEARRWQFHGNRERVIQGASQAALYWLRTTLLEKIGT